MSVVTRVLHGNNARAQLGAQVGLSDVVITLASGQGARFPSPGANQVGKVTLENVNTGAFEIATYTNKTGDVLSGVVRAQEGTSAGVWVVATTRVGNRLTAGTISQFLQTPGGDGLIVSLAGSAVGTQNEINFIQGSGIALTVTNNSGAGRVDVEVATGPLVSPVIIADNDPILEIRDTNASTNNQRWQHNANGTVYTISAVSDDGSTTSPAISITRSTITIATVNLIGTNVQANGSVIWTQANVGARINALPSISGSVDPANDYLVLYDASAAAAVKVLPSQVGEVPAARTITGTNSVAGGGDLSANRTLSLVNDTASPGNDMFYGTNGSGTRGWYAVTGGSPGGADGNIQYNGSGSFAGSALFAYQENTNTSELHMGDASNDAYVVGHQTGLYLYASDTGDMSATGGSYIYLGLQGEICEFNAVFGDSGNPDGGPIFIRAGSADSASGDGGNLEMRAGDSTTETGGSVLIFSGAGATSADRGVIQFTIGASTALTITATREWDVDGSVGTSGQVLTSQGAGASPIWASASGGSPGGSTGQLQYNNAGSFGGANLAYEANFLGVGMPALRIGVAGDFLSGIVGPSQTGSTGSGSPLYVMGGAPGTTSGTGGDLVLTGGGAPGTGNGGNATIQGGLSIGSGNGGNANVTGGNGATNGNGGNVNLTPGTAAGSGIPGVIRHLGAWDDVNSAITVGGGTQALNLSLGNSFHLTLNTNTTISFTNPPASGRAFTFTVWLLQDGTGSRIVTWPASVKWSDGITPVLTTTINRLDAVTLTTLDGGSTYYGGQIVANITP